MFSMRARYVLTAYQIFGQSRNVDLCLDQIVSAFITGVEVHECRQRIAAVKEELHNAGRFLESDFCHSLWCAAGDQFEMGGTLNIDWLIPKTLEITRWAPSEYVNTYRRNRRAWYGVPPDPLLVL